MTIPRFPAPKRRRPWGQSPPLFKNGVFYIPIFSNRKFRKIPSPIFLNFPVPIFLEKYFLLEPALVLKKAAPPASEIKNWRLCQCRTHRRNYGASIIVHSLNYVGQRGDFHAVGTQRAHGECRLMVVFALSTIFV